MCAIGVQVVSNAILWLIVIMEKTQRLVNIAVSFFKNVFKLIDWCSGRNGCSRWWWRWWHLTSQMTEVFVFQACLGKRGLSDKCSVHPPHAARCRWYASHLPNLVRWHRHLHMQSDLCWRQRLPQRAPPCQVTSPPPIIHHHHRATFYLPAFLFPLTLLFLQYSPV